MLGVYYFTMLLGPSIVISTHFCIYDLDSECTEMNLYQGTLIMIVLKCTSSITGTADNVLVSR